jgi:hypothetical protein
LFGKKEVLKVSESKIWEKKWKGKRKKKTTRSQNLTTCHFGEGDRKRKKEAMD